MKFIRLTIEEVDEDRDDKRQTLFFHYQKVERETTQRTVRCMLAKAAERFPDPPKPRGGF
jgi:hypothetical protein